MGQNMNSEKKTAKVFSVQAIVIKAGEKKQYTADYVLGWFDDPDASHQTRFCRSKNVEFDTREELVAEMCDTAKTSMKFNSNRKDVTAEMLSLQQEFLYKTIALES